MFEELALIRKSWMVVSFRSDHVPLMNKVQSSLCSRIGLTRIVERITSTKKSIIRKGVLKKRDLGL